MELGAKFPPLHFKVWLNVPTCRNESPVQGRGAQAGAGIMHGRQRLLLQLLGLGLKA